MFIYAKRQGKSLFFTAATRCLVFLLSFSLVFGPAAVQAQSLPAGQAGINFLNLPIPGTMIQPSPAFVPVLLKGMTIHPEDPLKFDFIIDSGNTYFTPDEIKKESEKLVKYFLASMTVPKDDLWVNLSPYEQERIIPEKLGKTELGRDMLAQDYILKQLTASLMYPEEELGKKFWDKVYQKAEEQFGTKEIPVNTFNKVWILPETATVYEHHEPRRVHGPEPHVVQGEHTVYIVDAHLKVMLDSDYKAREALSVKSEAEQAARDTKIGSQIIREIIIPEIEKEVNQGQHFAPLRQIYHSLILAKWYKETVKNSLLSQVYVDQNKITGVESEEKDIKERIYAQYMEAYKKGVFNFIKEDYDTLSQEMIPRKYFSGGITGDVKITKSSSPVIESNTPKYKAVVEVTPQKDGASSPINETDQENHLKKILNKKRERFKKQHFFDDRSTGILEDIFNKASEEYRQVLKEFADASVDSQSASISDLEEIQKKQNAAEEKRMKIVRRLYEIGRDALNLNDTSSQPYKGDRLVALKAFLMVLQMQILMKHSYGETVENSVYKLADKAMPELMSKAKARVMGLSKEYIKSMDMIKDARQLYLDAFKRYLGQALDDGDIGAVAIENIIYGLGISDVLLFQGNDDQHGREMKHLIEMASSLRELLITKDSRITPAMKTQAAAYLQILFNRYVHNGQAAGDIDEVGETVPTEVAELIQSSDDKENKLKKAEGIAFQKFLGDGDAGPSHGHSKSATEWLAKIYNMLGTIYYFESVKKAIALQTERSRKELTQNLKEVSNKDSLALMLEEFNKKNFFQVAEEFRNGTKKGILTEVPIRLELSAGGAQDSLFLSTFLPEGYNILNLAALLSREGDPNEARHSIEITFEIRDQDKMPKDEAGKPALVTVESLDMGFSVHATEAGDILKKSKASLVLDTLISMGLFPEAIMKKAQEEGRGAEALEKILEHVFGKNKGLVITMHVHDITAGSGLAVSSMLAMGVATTFDVMKGKGTEDPHTGLIYMDDEESIKRAITTSQTTVSRLGGKAGTQDEVSGLGGILSLTAGEVNKEDSFDQAGFKGSVVPQMNKIQISEASKHNLQHAVRIVRIGLSEEAEDTLDQIFTSTILNRSLSQKIAWGQLTIEMIKALQRGDIVELGRLANAAVPLRQAMAPVSMNAYVLEALERIKGKYGADYTEEDKENSGAGFSYGITGARSTGSVLLFFDPRLEDTEIDNIVKEVEEAIEEELSEENIGKLAPKEEKPHSYKKWQISNRGIQVRKLDKEEMSKRNTEIAESRGREQTKKSANKERRVLYSKKEVEDILKENKPYLSQGLLKDDSIKTLMHGLAEDNAIKNALKNIAKKIGQSNEAEMKDVAEMIRNKATEVAAKKFRKFNAPGAASSSPIEEKFDGYNFIDMTFEQAIVNEIERRKNLIASLDSEIKKILEKDRRTLQDDENLRINRGKKAFNKKLVAILEKRPNPEFLYYGHPLIKYSDAYRNAFGDIMNGLKNAYEEGSLVFVAQAGGLGGRFFKGEAKVKVETPFLAGNEPKATFMGLMFRRWNDFLSHFSKQDDGIPYREGFFHITQSPFTKSAIEAKADEHAREAGLDPRYTAKVTQGLNQPVFPTDLEIISDLIVKLEQVETPERRKEMIRDAVRNIQEAKKELRGVQEGYIRAPYQREGLNPLGKYNPNGNAGSLQTMLTETSEVYTLSNLRKMGYKINEEMVEIMSTSEIPEVRDQLNKGMPLAKAALLIEDDSTWMGIIQQSSSRSGVGGNQVALGFAVRDIMKDGVMAVAQYANVAGGVAQGGVLVVNTDDDTVTTLEGQRELFLDKYFLTEGHTALATGTVFVNMRQLYKILARDKRTYLLSGPDALKELWNTRWNEWDKLYAIKDRKEDDIGRSDTWKVLQEEVPLQWVLTWMQKEFGRESVKYQEVTPSVAFHDDKELSDLLNGLEQDANWLAMSIQRTLPWGRIEDAEVTFKDLKKWAEFYKDDEMFSHALEVIRQAKRALDIDQEHNTLSLGEIKNKKRELGDLIQEIKREKREKGKRQGKEPRNYRMFESHLRNIFSEHNKPGFKISDLPSKDNRLREIKKLILQIEGFLEVVLADMMQSLGKRLQDVPEPLLLSMSSRLMLKYSIDETLERYGFEPNIISPAEKRELQEVIADTRNGMIKNERGEEISLNIDDSMHPVKLAFLRFELTALYDQVAEAILTERGEIEGMRVSEHKVTFLVDKDATMEDPGHILKQLTGDEFGRAGQIVKTALRGARVIILTGSTTQEAWKHVLEPISQVLKHMKVPEIMKEMAIARIKIMANDGTIIVASELGGATALTFQEQGWINPDDLKPNDKFFDGQWQGAGTLFRQKKNKMEDKRNRILMTEAAVKAYLKQLFSEDMMWNKLKETVNSPDKENLFTFINTLRLNENDIFNLEDDRGNFQSDEVLMARLIRAMLNNTSENNENNVWWRRFDEIIDAGRTGHEEKRINDSLKSDGTSRLGEEKGKITLGQNIQNTLRKLEGNEAGQQLIGDEVIYAAFHLISFKDSAGTYGSISGDKLDTQSKKKNSPVAALKNGVLNRGFWEGVKNHFDDYLKNTIKESRKKFKEKPPERKNDFLKYVAVFLDEKGNGIPFETRNGPGYLNMSFGGVSKKNYLNGMLQDDITKGHVVVIMGDSITDQGIFPFVLESEELSADERDMIRTTLEALRVDSVQIEKLKDRLHLDRDKNVLTYEGILTENDFIELMKKILEFQQPEVGSRNQKIDQVKKDIDANVHKTEVNKLFYTVLETIFNKSELVHKARIPFRVLLGTLFEKDDQKIEELMEGGLIRTGHKRSTRDPFGSGHERERWGPVAFYPIVKGVMDAAAMGYVIPKDGMEPLEMRDRILRAVQEAMNANNVFDTEIIPSQTMKKVSEQKSKKEYGIRFVTNSDKENAILYDLPVNEIKEKISQRIVPGRQKAVREILSEAKKKGVTLSIKGNLRGLDGPGSSLDLIDFQKKLIRKDVDGLGQLPSLPTITSTFDSTVTFEPAEEGTIVFDAADYFRSNEERERITGEKAYRLKDLDKKQEEITRVLTNVRDKESFIPRIDYPVFILNYLFGLKGIKVTLNPISPMAMAGGVQSSNNGFILGLIAAGSIFTGADLTVSEILTLTIKLENEVFGRTTGGQGHLATMLGGVYQNILTSRIGENGEFNYSVVSIPFLEERQYESIEKHMMIVQPGRLYEHGRDASQRSARPINDIWTSLLDDQQSTEKFKRMMALSQEYISALKDENFKKVAETMIEYVKIRNQLIRKWLQLSWNHREELRNKVDPNEMEVLALSLINEIESELHLTNEPTEKNIDKLLDEHSRIYTYKGAFELFNKASEEGIALMPVGAGGNGANMIAVDPKGIKHLTEFLRTQEEVNEKDGGHGKERKFLRYIQEPEAEAVKNPGSEEITLSGFMEFKIGGEPIRFNGFDELGQLDGTETGIGKAIRNSVEKLRNQILEHKEIKAEEVLAFLKSQESASSSSPISSEEDVGGIDLNEINVDRQGAGVDIQFDPVVIQEIIDRGVDGVPLSEVEGFAPVIINLVPLPSVLPLLGLEPKREEEFELTQASYTQRLK